MVYCPTPITQHPTPNTQHPTPTTQHPTPKSLNLHNRLLGTRQVRAVERLHLNGMDSLAQRLRRKRKRFRLSVEDSVGGRSSNPFTAIDPVLHRADPDQILHRNTRDTDSGIRIHLRLTLE